MSARVRLIGGSAYAGARAGAHALTARVGLTGGQAQAVAPVVEPEPIAFRVRRLVLEDGTEIEVNARGRATTGE